MPLISPKIKTSNNFSFLSVSAVDFLAFLFRGWHAWVLMKVSAKGVASKLVFGSGNQRKSRSQKVCTRPMPSQVQSRTHFFYFAKSQVSVPVEVRQLLRHLFRLSIGASRYDCARWEVLVYDGRMPSHILFLSYIPPTDRGGEGLERNLTHGRIQVCRETF